MKKISDLFEDKPSRRYKDQVLASAKREMQSQSSGSVSMSRFGFLKLAFVFTGIIGLSWLGSRAIFNKEESNQLALLEADIDMLENLDWLEDLDVLENEEDLG